MNAKHERTHAGTCGSSVAAAAAAEAAALLRVWPKAKAEAEAAQLNASMFVRMSVWEVCEMD